MSFLENNPKLKILIREHEISRILNDPKKVRDALQKGINDALLLHKKMGNPICVWRDGKVAWIAPDDIIIK